MNGRNLLPIERQHAKRQRRAVRRWVVINGVYAGLLATAGGVYAWNAVDAARPPGIAAVAADIEKANSKLNALRQEALSLRATLQSVNDVSGRPDWSVLLNAVSQTLGEDVVLSSIDTAADPAVATPVAAVASGDAAFGRVLIAGVGRNQQAVTQFVLRVESMRFFNGVRLLQTAPRPWQGSDGIGFQIDCTLHDSAGVSR